MSEGNEERLEVAEVVADDSKRPWEGVFKVTTAEKLISISSYSIQKLI